MCAFLRETASGYLRKIDERSARNISIYDFATIFRGLHPVRSMTKYFSISSSGSSVFFKAAFEAGINFFDTADVYSQGMSEEITGRAIVMIE